MPYPNPEIVLGGDSATFWTGAAWDDDVEQAQDFDLAARPEPAANMQQYDSPLARMPSVQAEPRVMTSTLNHSDPPPLNKTDPPEFPQTPTV